MELIDLLNQLFEKAAQNKIRFLTVSFISNDDTFEIAWSGEASYLEKRGLIEQAKDDMMESIYDEMEDE